MYFLYKYSEFWCYIGTSLHVIKDELIVKMGM